MAENVAITPGTGDSIGADQVTDATLGVTKIQYTKLMDGVIGSTNKLSISALGAASVDINAIGANALGQELKAASIPVVVASDQIVSVSVPDAILCVSTTAATGVAVTATLPAVVAQFHHITLIEIVKYFTVANAASATPLVVTTTNLPGSLAFTFGQPVGAIGITDRMIHSPESPLKSSVVNTATTIVCPATTGIIWRVNVYYFAA